MKKLLCTVLILLTPVLAAAQQRPLVTEDPEVVGPGQILLELGFDQIWEQRYPVSGLQGTLMSAPTFGVSFGLGIAELQVDGAFFQRLRIKERFDAPLADRLEITGDQTSSISDFTVATKIRLMREDVGRPAIGVRFGARLPNASNERGLGPDTTDLFASLLFAKTIQSMRLVGNAGVAVMGDATDATGQNDVLTYGLSLARALTQAAEVVGEINGRKHVSGLPAPPGTGSSAIARGGLRFTKGPVRIDGGVILGILENDPGFGVTAGLTWVFNAFTIQP